MLKLRGWARPMLYLLAAAAVFEFGQDVGLGQNNSAQSSAPTGVSEKPLTSSPKAAEALFLRLGEVDLDPARVYRARDLSFDRAAFHITLEDGVIAFTRDVAGRVTGAFFEGEGEILLTPPNQVERASMMLQTGAAILEERFASAYFRFNDDTFAELQPSLYPDDNPQDFIARWNETAHNLAAADALRLLVSFSRLLPLEGQGSGVSTAVDSALPEDRFLHVRMQGRTKGIFDVYFDSNAPEQVWAGQLRTLEGSSYYDVWTSFSLLKKSSTPEAANTIAAEEGRANAIDIPDYDVRADIKPPTTIDAEAVLQLHVRQGGQRAILFELARTLLIKQVEADGHAVEFIHNPALEGTQLARRGNDLVAVIFSRPLQSGQRITLRFVYGGDVLSEAGPGLLYVGARGTWYPNRGIAMSNFNLEFHYPSGWTLVATGKRMDTAPSTSSTEADGTAGDQVSHWTTERPIPVAGFNLGKYQSAVARAGDVTVEAFATRGVERGFPQPEPQVIVTDPSGTQGTMVPPMVITSASPSPARNAQMVADMSAHAIEFFSQRFGPFPYGQLSLTQMPGNLSQGWPGLIFLSSLSFLTAQQKSELHFKPVENALIGGVIAHETAHQWWGDLVIWNGYRDQWLSEALANYSSLMLFEAENPPQFRAAMERYRDDLLQKNKEGRSLVEDGPVTLGMRLSCSQFPEGYETVSYERGTWLLHMLRYMMRDAEHNQPGDEPFMRALLKIRQRYEGKSVTTRDVLQVFEEELPRSLWYEGHKSLDWFYQGWINGSAVPRIELRNLKYTDKAGGTAVSGMILQKDAPDDLVTPVPLYASRGGKLTFLGRIFADGPETTFHLSAPAGTRKIVIDPRQTLLARGR